MKLNLVRIFIPDFATYWDQIKGKLENACARSGGRYSVKTELAAFETGDRQWWVAVDDENRVWAFAITEMIVFPTGLRAGCIVMGTGHQREEWQGMRKDIEAWFTSEGCELSQTYARKGWAKEFTEYSYTHVILEKRLENM